MLGVSGRAVQGEAVASAGANIPYAVERSAFSAALAAAPPVATGSARGSAAVTRVPSGTLHLTFRRDDVLEYQLTIANADHEAFGSGYLYRAGGSATEVRVATLFTDLSLSGPYVQLRGTGIVETPLTMPDLLSRIRQWPDSFSIRVVPVEHSREALSGHLR